MSTTHGRSDAVLAAGQSTVPRRGLTPRQARFVAAYVIDLNATQAAIRAGYSARTAASIGHENLRKPEISAAVQATVQRHLARLDLSFERIVQEAARVGISDLRDLFTEDGQLLAPHELPDDVRRAVASIKLLRTHVEVNSDGDRTTTTRLDTVEIKFWDKLRGLELVGKLKGFMKPPQVTLEAGDSWHEVLVRMTKAQAAAKLAEKSPPTSSTAEIMRGVGTDHQGHHGSQG